MERESEKASAKDFEILGLRSGSSPAQVKRIYRELVKLWHPDQFQQRSLSEQQKAEERLKQITTAYRRISRGWKSQEEEKKKQAPKSGASPSAQSPPSPPPSESYTLRNAHSAPWKLKLGSFGTFLFLLILACLAARQPISDWLPGHFEMRPPSSDPQKAGDRAAHQSKSWPSTGTPHAERQERPDWPPESDTQPEPLPLLSRRPSISHFTLGSTEAEVRAIQGAPARVRGQTWIYGLSEIQFKDRRVWRYNNFDGFLRVRLDPPVMPHGDLPQFFTLGSTQNQVLLTHGTPTRVDNHSWFYGFSEVRFKNGRVVGYDNYFGNLKIRIFPSRAAESQPAESYFTVGSTKDEVLAIQGTPTSIQGNLWFYHLSNVLFRNDKVQHVVDSGGLLRFAPPEEPKTRQHEPG